MAKKKKIYERWEDFLDDELQDPEAAAAYLTEAFADEDRTVFLIALMDVIRAQEKKVAAVAKKSKINRQSLHRMLSKKGNPRLSNLVSLFDTLGISVQFSIKQ